MDTNERSRVRVGIVLALGLGLIIVAVYAIGGGSRWLLRTQSLEAHFHRINGLQNGAPVALSGVTIGAVETVDFPPSAQSDFVVVRMWIENRAALRIPVDSTASIATMGLLGDKFVEISPGNSRVMISPGAVVASQDPIDYEALLAKKNTGDLIANLMEASNAARNILVAIDKGNGLLSQLIRSQPAVGEAAVANIRQSLDNIDRASAQLAETLTRVNRGQGLAGALLANTPSSRKLATALRQSIEALRESALQLQQLTAALSAGQGLLPQLISDRALADQILAQTRDSSRQLDEILTKINEGQGTLGKLVNDPALYNQAQGFLGGSRASWGSSLLRGLYTVTHPFDSGTGSDSASTPHAAEQGGGAQ